MLGDLLAKSYMYLFGAMVIGFVGYALWSGIKESTEDEQFVFEKLSELFEKRPEGFVLRSLSAPDSSKVGSVTFDNCSAMTLVCSGPNQIFIAGRDKDEFFSIPWDRIDSINDSNNKRLTLLVNRPAGKPTHIEIPWSDNMTLEGWEQHKYMSE